MEASVKKPISFRKFSIIGRTYLFFMMKGPTTHQYLISMDFLKFRKCPVSTINFCLINSIENTLGVKKAGTK